MISTMQTTTLSALYPTPSPFKLHMSVCFSVYDQLTPAGEEKTWEKDRKKRVSFEETPNSNVTIEQI